MVAADAYDYVPARKKLPGWDERGSLCKIYFEECKRLGCTPNSEMVRQLVRRARMISPLPYHRTRGKSRLEMLHLAFDHLDLDGSGDLARHEVVGFCRGMNPEASEEEVREMFRAMDEEGGDDDGRIDREEYIQAMRFLLTYGSDEDFERGVLETLATRPAIADLPDRESKLAVLFRHLDDDDSGDLTVEEMFAVATDVNPASRRAREEVSAHLSWADADEDRSISMTEFIDAMTFLTSYLAEEDFDASVEEQMAYSKFTYRCDAAYLGQKGVLALLPVFAVDASFTHLVLRGCGVHNDGIGKVCESLLGHPTLSYLDIGDNPISEGGVDAVVRLIHKTPTLVECVFDKCFFTRGYSNTHETRMEDHPNTNGRPIVSALEYNRHPPVVLHGAAAVAAMDIPALLRAKKSELKVLFYSLAGVDGRVSFEELRDGMLDCAEEWGVVSSDLGAFLDPEVVFGRMGSQGADEDGDGRLTFGEFCRALVEENVRAKVLEACRGPRRVDLKVLFYAMAGTDGELTLEEIAEGLEGTLGEQSEAWGFTVEEMHTVFNRETFAAMGEADVDGGAADFDGDGKLSWTEFYTRLTRLQ